MFRLEHMQRQSSIVMWATASFYQIEDERNCIEANVFTLQNLSVDERVSTSGIDMTRQHAAVSRPICNVCQAMTICCWIWGKPYKEKERR